SILILFGATAAADEQLTSPYRQDVQSALRGLNESEIAELRAGAGMGLAWAAELNSYPGPRHVLDAVHAGRLQASPDQVTQIRRIFDEMRDDARRIGGEILIEEQQLEAAFHPRRSPSLSCAREWSESPRSRASFARSTFERTLRRAQSCQRLRSPATTNSAA